MKIKSLWIFLILILMCSGGCKMLCDNWGMFCQELPTTKPEVNTLEDIKGAQETINNSSAVIEKASGEIKTEVNKINTETIEVQSKIPEETKESINPHLKTIKESSTAILEDTSTIDKATAELSGAQSLLDNAGKKVVVVESALDKMARERDLALEAKRKAEEARDAAIHKALKWLTIACVIAAGALGVFGFMYQSKMCLTLSAICIVVMSISIFIETYFIYVAIAGGIILAALVAMLIYNIIIQKKAFKEVVDTVEVTQENLSKENRKKLFGGKGQTGIMDGLQSKTTMDLVQKEKGKMSKLWMYAKANGEDK